MFDHTHYVPILRWKRGEWVALRRLAEDVRAFVTPLVEVTRKSLAARSDGTLPTVSAALSKVAGDLASNWGWRPVFLDLLHLPEGLRADNRLPALVHLAAEARRRGASLIPVTGLGRGADYQSAVASVVRGGAPGACIRLVASDLARPTLGADIDALLRRLCVERADADLVIDLQFVGDASPDWAGILRPIPAQQQWRTFTVAAGSFPLDLTGFSLGDHRVRRADWLGWLNLARAPGGCKRLPTFADYTTQHGAPYREPPEGANVSASIRYTSAEDWVVLRGRGIRSEGGGAGQYHSEAQWLCRKPEVFCGRDFSDGDQYIHERSVVTDPTGSAETLLRAGFNHHMTFVVRQIANLFGT